jgi:hypothetical protein
MTLPRLLIHSAIAGIEEKLGAQNVIVDELMKLVEADELLRREEVESVVILEQQSLRRAA